MFVLLTRCTGPNAAFILVQVLKGASIAKLYKILSLSDPTNIEAELKALFKAPPNPKRHCHVFDVRRTKLKLLSNPAFQLVGRFDDRAMLERDSIVEAVCVNLHWMEPRLRPSLVTLAASPGSGKSAALMLLAQPARLLETALSLKGNPSAELLCKSLTGKYLIPVTTSFNSRMPSFGQLPILREAGIRLLYRFSL